jgi:hypothetical protein
VEEMTVGTTEAEVWAREAALVAAREPNGYHSQCSRYPWGTHCTPHQVRRHHTRHPSPTQFQGTSRCTQLEVKAVEVGQEVVYVAGAED